MKRTFRIPLAVLLTLTILGSTYALAAETATVATTPAHRNETKWWKDRHAAKLAKVKELAGNVDLLMIGDSITHGWEGSGKGVWQKYYANRKPFNIGFSGDRTEHVLWRLDHGEVDGISPKLAVMMIGTNNVGHGSSTPAQTIEGVKAILAKLEQKLPKTKVLLLAVFPRGADENDHLRKKVNEINQGLPALADGKRVFYLDINSKFLDENKVLPKSIMPDLLHPNAQGYEIWANAIEPSVKKLLGEKPIPATVPAHRNNTKWWKNRHAAKLTKVKEMAGNVDLVMLGDSITHGWESSGGQKVWKKFYADRKALNLGYGGDHTQHVLWRLDNGEVDGISPKLVVLMIGTNNVGWPQANPYHAIEGIKAVLAKLEEKLPETKVLLLAVFPRGADENDVLRKKVNTINKALPAMADGKRVFYLDIGPKFLDDNKVLSKSIMPDLLHPNGEGYQIWADAVEPSIKKLLGEK